MFSFCVLSSMSCKLVLLIIVFFMFSWLLRSIGKLEQTNTQIGCERKLRMNETSREFRFKPFLFLALVLI